MMKFSINDIIYRDPEMLSSDLDGETVMMSIKNGAYYGLNEIGSRIWEITKEEISIREIIEILTEEYEVDEKTCYEDVVSFLEELSKRDLILKK